MKQRNYYPLLTLENAPLSIILANGDFPRLPFLLNLLSRAIEDPSGQLICTDGSVQKLLAFGAEPDAVVGDLDSLPTELKERLGSRLHHESEQDTNDLSKAVRYLKAHGGCPTGLCILGAAGGREDHLLGNVSLLPYYAHTLDMDVLMLTDQGYFRVLRPGSHRCAIIPGRQVSFFSLKGGKVSVEGVKWVLKDRELEQLWSGTLNQAIEPELRIRCEKSLVVYFANEYK